MTTRNVFIGFFALLTGLMVQSCNKETLSMQSPTDQEHGSHKKALLTENMESGTKTAYAAANVTLGSGTWTFTDALIGNSTSDRKNGTQSARVTASGKLTMLFNKTAGSGTVNVVHALYGTDAASTWELWMSTNNGTSWSKVGSTITTGSTTLTTQSFTVNQTVDARFEIRKVSGTGRINIDDVSITDYSGGTGGGGTTTGTIKILFDAKKGETAGNADWVIDADLFNLSYSSTGTISTGGSEANAQRTPTSAQSGITSTTAETYWKGAISAWGVDCAKKGYIVESLPYNGSITYGNTSNAQDLSNYKIYVVCEPNIKYTTAEKTAIIQFVQNGGRLLMIADHDVSDRNNDGWDSPDIWNDLMTNNGLVTNPFGMKFDLANFSQISSTVANLPSDPVLHGSYGDVTQIQFSNGTSLTLSTTANSSVKGLIYKTGGSGSTNVLVASCTYGTGKVIAIGDSSIADDGTGDTGDSPLFYAYTGEASGNHRKLLMNAIVWLAQ